MFHGQWPKSAMDILGIDVNLGQCHAWSVMVRNAQSLPVSYGDVGRSLLTSDRTLSTLTSRPRWPVTAILTIRCPRWPVTVHVDQSSTLTSHCPRWPVTVIMTIRCPRWPFVAHVGRSLSTLASRCAHVGRSLSGFTSLWYWPLATFANHCTHWPVTARSYISIAISMACCTGMATFSTHSLSCRCMYVR